MRRTSEVRRTLEEWGGVLGLSVWEAVNGFGERIERRSNANLTDAGNSAGGKQAERGQPVWRAGHGGQRVGEE